MVNNAVASCRRCNRLVRYLKKQQRQYPKYHNAPVQATGDHNARLLIVGLAPGLHGANASGIPFTGDSSGDALFHQLRAHGFISNGPGDDHKVQLDDCRITNAVKCLPPDNLPTATEVANCNCYLNQEIETIGSGGVILALGLVAHKAVLKALGLTLSHYPFGHRQEHELPGQRLLVDSYHCSRYNMNIGRLTEAGFAAVFQRVRQVLG